MHEFSKTRSLGGLNYDDEVRQIPATDYIYAKNIRNAIVGANRGGTLTNINGNIEITSYCLPYNNNIFPTGRCKVIGSLEDTKNNTVIYFVWNKTGKHQILRYYRDLTDPNNLYGVVHQVIQYDFGWKKSTRINSANIVYGNTEAGADSEETGDLLYWCDKQPRKINLTKGEICGKLKCWNLFLPITIEGNIPDTTTYLFKNFAGATIFSKTVNTSSLVTNSVLVNYVSTSPNGHIELSGNFDLSGVTSITISGSATPSNNKTYNVLAWAYQSSVNITDVEVEGDSGTGADETVTVQWQTPEAEARNFVLSKIAQAFNSDSSSPVTATFCDCHLEFCEKVAGTVWTILSDTDANIISPENWYGATLIDRFFDRCKWQPLNAPRGTFAKDLNYEPNYVQRKVFQFRLEYDYDDLERSALGVWSQIPINNLGCDGTSDKSFNYIDVNFEDDLIANAETLVLLKRVRFIARELNTGSDRSVIQIQPCDFLDYADGEWLCHFKFYNNIISSPIDAATAAKLFDNVPLETNDERFVKNRIVEFGVLEGYNAPECVQAKAQIDFGETPQRKLVKITGKIKILTFGLSASGTNPEGNFYGILDNNSIKKYPFWESPVSGINARLRRGGVFHDILRATNDFAYFGGGTFNGTAKTDFGIIDGMEDVFDQRLPEDGFAVYAAGTEYVTISKQISIGLPTDGAGALDTSTSDKIQAIGNYLWWDFLDTNPPTNELYSTFELLVPDNDTYVIRLASHWCSFGDKLQKGFAYNISAGTNYQKTSTNVWSVLDTSGNQEFSKEITVTVGTSDVDAGTFIVADLAPVHDTAGAGVAYAGWRPLNCYLLSDENDSGNPNDANFTGIPVEKTIVTYNGNGTDFADRGILAPLYPNTTYNTGWQNSCITDHNGYWFGIGGWSTNPDLSGVALNFSVGKYFPISAYQTKLGAPNDVWKIRDADTTIYVGSYTDYYNKTLVGLNYDGTIVEDTTPTNANLIFGFVAANTPNSRTNSLTFVDGTILDQNNKGVSNALVILENGSFELTVTNGTYSIPAWSDMLTPNTGQFSAEVSTFTPLSDNNRIVDDIIISGLIFCAFTYPNGQIIDIDIVPYDSAITGYNPTVHYIATTLSIQDNIDPTAKARKRGGNYPVVGRGYDNAGRLCSCFALVSIYVPFITEDLGKYNIQDFGGGTYPSNTFKYGKPSIKVILDPTTVFPTWMTSLQIMFPINTIYGRYLQWVANQVTYVAALATETTPEIDTSFQNGDATAIKISISNIVDYSAQNNNSLVGYQYEAGDRLRLITDRNLNYINGLNDFEITSYDATTQEVIIKPEGYKNEIQSGSLFEIFNPKTVETQDEQIFYECGEVIKVVNGIPQEFERIFTAGDTYWRGRLITVNDEATKFAAAYPVVIEDASVSDFYPSQAQDIGRIGIIDPAFKQLFRPTLLRCSNAFIPSTAINGLSSFEELNQKELDRSYGNGERVLYRNNNLVCVFSNRELSNYIGLVTLQQAAADSGVVSISDQYFGTEYPHVKILGTNHPSSVFNNDGVIFGFNSQRANCWRNMQESEDVISDVKMINYFQQLMIDGVLDATAVYDRYSEIYILTLWREYQYRSVITSVSGTTVTIQFQGSFPIVGEDATLQYLKNGIWIDIEGEITSVGTNTVTIDLLVSTGLKPSNQVNLIYGIPETLNWFNGNNGVIKERWMSFDDRTPDNWQQIGSELVSFMNGRLWIEEKNDLYNNFYGKQFTSQVKPVFNAEPEVEKVWNSVVLQQLQADNKCDWSCPIIENDLPQLSRINKAGFVKKASTWYAPFKRDLLDISVPANIRISQGRALRHTSLTCLLENDSVGEVRLYSWQGNYTISERSGK